MDFNIDPPAMSIVGAKNITQQNFKIDEIENLNILRMRRIKSDMITARHLNDAKIHTASATKTERFQTNIRPRDAKRS